MIKSKIEGSVSSDRWGSICSDRVGSVSSGQVGSIWTEFPSNLNITYRAGDQIDLQPGSSVGFSVSGGAYFHGFIHGCDHSGNSFQRYSHSTNNDNNSTDTQTQSSVSINSTLKESKVDKMQMIVQPNPNNGTFILQINGKFNSENSVEVTDLMGRSVYNKNFIKQKETLNIDLQNGTYLIKYYDGIEAHSQPFIINR